MPNILIYTFFSYSKKTSKGLYELQNLENDIDKLFIPNRFATKKLLTLIPKYDYVIGIADHNKNAKRSRFDPKYINKYSKQDIIENGTEYLESNLDIDIPNTFYTFPSTTNGPCNRSGYLVMNDIVNNKLNTKFGFFHLKKDSCMDDLREIIRSL